MDGVARKLSERLVLPHVREGNVVLVVTVAGTVLTHYGLVRAPSWPFLLTLVLWVLLRAVLPFYWKPFIYELPLEYWDKRYVDEFGQGTRDGIDESQRRSQRGQFSLPVYPNG